jgi:D-glycero-D-manno-heptose 1,7-bisphosphate phosphatase
MSRHNAAPPPSVPPAARPVTPSALDRPRQAVILAGGRGTRLAPLTLTRPKPMIAFHGRPFLEYMIEMLRQQGFERILLLLGYLPEVIRDHFGDGSGFGVGIDYAVSDVEDDTGRRLALARHRLDPVFFLAYCDNYWPLDFAPMWERFHTDAAWAMVTAYANRDGYTRNNLRIEDGRVALYDKSRTARDLAGTDIGFLILRREVLDLLPEGNPSFESTIYPRLCATQRLLAHVTEHRYYSVGSLERLPITEAFLARAPTIILDRDGVLNRRMPKAEYVRCWADWEWLPGALEALSLLGRAGWRILVVTNQAGIARGVMTEASLAEIHQRMQADAAAVGGLIEAIYHCPHGWDDGCDCRKPKPGMLFAAQRRFHLDLSRVLFIGDDERDAQAAAAAGCPFRLVTERISLLDLVTEHLGLAENPCHQE